MHKLEEEKTALNDFVVPSVCGHSCEMTFSGQKNK